MSQRPAGERSPIVLITGSGGRVGRLLRAAWSVAPPDGFTPLWHGRGARPEALPLGSWVEWPMLEAPAPRLPPLAALINLAGVTEGSAEDLARNTDLALAAHAAAGGCHVFHLSSAAVYAPHAIRDCAETDAPAPPGPYGAAKLAMEQAVADLPDVTLLRVANVVGADALLGAARRGKVTLDPVPGRDGGPLRSWIGPLTLAQVLGQLVNRATGGWQLPLHLNVAQGPPIAMAAMLDAAGLPWEYGHPRVGVVPRVALSTTRLQSLMPVPSAQAVAMVLEWRRLARFLT